jgi:protein O-GlcNAc transferase
MTDSTFNARLSQAVAFLQNADYGQAETLLRALEQESADDPLLLQLLGIVNLKLKRLAEAEDFFRRAIARKPDFVEAHSNLGIVLRMAGKFSESIGAYETALKFRPDDPDILSNLANVCQDAGEGPRAAEAFRQAIELCEPDADLCINLGLALKTAGRAAESAEAFARAAQIDPQPIHFSKRLFMLHFDPRADAKSIFAEHREWDIRFGEPLRSRIRPHDNDRKANRRLRVGYVSADFRRHSVSFFIEPLLAAHDPAQVETFLYSNSGNLDDVTDRLRASAHHWRDIYNIDDAAAAEIIRADRIDILVELGGHTEGSRLLLFAQKPAPIQVAYLGYPDTTGLSAIDYRLTDAFLDPPGSTDEFYSEKLLRLPRTFACYRPPSDAPAVAMSPAIKNGFVTFASLNNFWKVTPESIECWANILSQVPHSRFVMAAHGLQSAETRRQIETIFETRGVAAQRLELLGRQSWHNYLALHNRADILLDTFPVGGHTVTCHALWMGMPVVTLAGKTSCQRLGASVLSNLNLQNLIATNPQEYVEKAVELAKDVPRLVDLRAMLRDKMSKSALMDGRKFARDVESAYCEMWGTFCVA